MTRAREDAVREGATVGRDDLEGSGVWYCRKHCGTVNEDQAHDVDDMCPWSKSNLDDNGRPYDPCDWTELLYRRTDA